MTTAICYLPSCPISQPNYCFLMHLEVKYFTNSKALTFNASQFYTLNPSDWLREKNVLKVLDMTVLLSRDQDNFSGGKGCFSILPL